jgi:hypothetical protein
VEIFLDVIRDFRSGRARVGYRPKALFQFFLWLGLGCISFFSAGGHDELNIENIDRSRNSALTASIKH